MTLIEILKETLIGKKCCLAKQQDVEIYRNIIFQPTRCTENEIAKITDIYEDEDNISIRAMIISGYYKGKECIIHSTINNNLDIVN